MPSDDPRVKRVLKRYLKSEQFFDASVELTSIALSELQVALRREADDKLLLPVELDEFALKWFESCMQVKFDPEEYDYFLHSYSRREFCSVDRVPETGLNFPCEDGPPSKIPLAKGLKWISVRPKDGKESYVGIGDGE